MIALYPALIFIASWLTVPVPDASDYDLWKEGRSYWYQSNWEKAAEAYQGLIERYPDSPRRCKSENYLGYCYYKMDRLQDAFDVFSELLQRGRCASEILEDAKATRLHIAFEMIKSEPSMEKILRESLRDSNIDIRLSGAVWLSELGDNSGIEVFFEVVQTEKDQDRRDTAMKHILKLGSEKDKARLQEILEQSRNQVGKQARMIRLTIRDLKTKEETVKLNLPIGLISVAIKALSDEQLILIEEETGINLKSLNFNLEDLRAGEVLFQIVDGDRQEIKLFLE